jgi:hypothetical protein
MALGLHAFCVVGPMQIGWYEPNTVPGSADRQALDAEVARIASN